MLYLEVIGKTTFTPGEIDSIAQRANSLDDTINKAALYAEKAVSRALYGKPWSIKLAKLGQEITFWKARKRDFLVVNDAYIQVSVTEMHRWHLNIIQHNNLDFIHSQLDNAWQDL
jgi:hypothetical protein